MIFSILIEVKRLYQNRNYRKAGICRRRPDEACWNHSNYEARARQYFFLHKFGLASTYHPLRMMRARISHHGFFCTSSMNKH